MIPKVIHYCWFGGKELPKDVKQCIKSWEKFAPEYEIRRWDESNFDIEFHPFMKNAYEEKCWAFVSDYARLKVVYDYGGVYLDTDVELIQSLDGLLDNPSYFGIQQIDHTVASGLGFGAEKGNNVVKAMLEIYDHIDFRKERLEEIACPILNTQVVEAYGYKYEDRVVKLDEVTIYPPEYFDPYGAGDVENLMNSNTISIHHYSASWTPWTQRLKRSIVRMIGQDTTKKIKDIIKKIKG